MTVNPSGWRPSTPANEQGEAHTVTGNRALMLEEPLIFEIGSTEQTGVDFEVPLQRPGPSAMRQQRLPALLDPGLRRGTGWPVSSAPVRSAFRGFQRA